MTTQINFLQNSSFQMSIPRFPNVQFFGQGFQIPEVSLDATGIETPFAKLNVAGDKMVYGPMVVNFIVDEMMNNYEEILKWIQSISFHTSYDDFTNYPEKGQRVQLLGEQDITITILNAKNNPIRDFIFYNAIPVSLSGVKMETTKTDQTYQYAAAVFEYDTFDLIKTQP